MTKRLQGSDPSSLAIFWYASYPFPPPSSDLQRSLVTAKPVLFPFLAVLSLEVFGH